jgi:signal transduction histidine kinase
MSQGVRRDVVDGVGYDVLASIDIPIVVVDDDRRIRQFNPKAAAVMRLRESDVGRLINEAVTSLCLREIADDREVHALDRSATYRMQVRPMAGGGSVLTFIDISELRTSVNADLQLAADRQRDTFLTSLSDELRTPLSAILLWTDVLRGLEQDDPHRAVAIDTIDECARAEARLVDDLLDLAMSASGELAIEARPVEAEPIVRDAIESIVPIAAERRINLVAALDGSGAHIWADPRRLHQVVKKLLINAVEFTVEGSDIHISLKQIGRALQLRLVDRGPGIDADFLPRVFEPFAQQDTSTARAHRGLGIGLALVRYLVERQAGTIDVESSDGQGTTFIVRFPVTASRA